MLDFSEESYRLLCQAIIENGYLPVTVNEYVNSRQEMKCVIMRHDVDSQPEYFLKYAQIEKEFGIKATYYFRTIDEVFPVEIIKEIASLGHEIGYHYEVLNLTYGDKEKAIDLFDKSLKEIRKYANVKTIAQHGSPLVGFYNPTLMGSLLLLKRYLKGERIFSKWRSIELWDEYNYKNWDLNAEAYIDIEYDRVLYLSDTGRSWTSISNRAKDFPPGQNYLKANINKTYDLIDLLKNNEFKQICLLTHLNQWKDNKKDWYTYFLLTKLRNFAKNILIGIWRKK